MKFKKSPKYTGGPPSATITSMQNITFKSKPQVMTQCKCTKECHSGFRVQALHYLGGRGPLSELLNFVPKTHPLHRVGV
ncbi:FAD-binding oxidoreductase [Sesbania bispinosa]|nr:FAD-binding oxidoreductase [Sesbania bispinosa]